MTTADNDPTAGVDTEANPGATETSPWDAETTAAADIEATRASDGSAAGDAGTTSGDHLVPDDAVVDIRSHWALIQQGFVDDPWSAVKDADTLVGDVLQKLAAIFEEQRQHLAGQWSDGESDTEQLRLTLRRYRDFLDRLLTT